jgi:hypothetical protein
MKDRKVRMSKHETPRGLMRTHSVPPLDLGEPRCSSQDQEREHKESIDKASRCGRTRMWLD